MKTLKGYVKEHFLELVDSQWSSRMIIDFIQSSANLDTDVHEAIKNIDSDDLIEYVADFDQGHIAHEIMDIQNLMIANAKEEIKTIILDIEEDLENER